MQGREGLSHEDQHEPYSLFVADEQTSYEPMMSLACNDVALRFDGIIEIYIKITNEP